MPHADHHRGFGTRAIKAATRAPRVEQGPAAVPIYQSATFHAADVDDYARLIGFEKPGYTYARIENPTADAMAGAFAELHGGEAGFAFGSGWERSTPRCSRCCSAVIACVCTRAVYGSTRALLERVLARLGVEVVFVDPIDLDAVARELAQLADPPALRRDHLQSRPSWWPTWLDSASWRIDTTPSWWSTTPSPRRTCADRSSWVPTWSSNPPPSG